jgi:hypothetical protein
MNSHQDHLTEPSGTPESLSEAEAWDFWEAAGGICGGYNSTIDADLIRVFIESDSRVEGRSVYSTDIAKRLGLAESYVELLKYILSGAGFCDYGTSPRGAWADHGRQDELRAKLLAWYERDWGEPLDLSQTT